MLKQMLDRRGHACGVHNQEYAIGRTSTTWDATGVPYHDRQENMPLKFGVEKR